MKLRNFALPVAVVILVGWIAALAARSPLENAPAALRAPLANDLAPAVERIDDELEGLWQRNGISGAPPVQNDLAVLRRLSLALHGTIPSLEEVRRFEADRRPDRLAHWTTAMLEDTRFADYFAVRLARSYVGVEEGQFIL